MLGKNVSIYGVHIPRKCIKSMHIYSCPSPPLNTPGRTFRKSVFPEAEGVTGGSYDLVYQNSIRK